MLKHSLKNENWERSQDVQVAIDEIYHIFRTLDDKFFFQTIDDVRKEVRNILRNYGLTKYVQY